MLLYHEAAQGASNISGATRLVHVQQDASPSHAAVYWQVILDKSEP